MSLLVQKYGGTSIGDTQRIGALAERVKASRATGDDIVVVVSAMSRETDRLAVLYEKIGGNDARESDFVLASGEQVAAGLTAAALQAIGVSARSFNGAQAGIITDNAHGKARIIDISTRTLRDALEVGQTPVITGFQGITADGAITTLGRGGSDTTAVALAAGLAADECQIYTDVDGIYTTDPRVCKKARLLKEVTFEEMLEMASLGSRVLQIRAVEFAGKYRVPLRVLSSFNATSTGTLIIYEEENMEKPVVTGVAFNRAEAKITVTGVPDQPGAAYKLLAPLAEGNINVDMILQNIGDDKRTSLSFTVHSDEFATALKISKQAAVAVDAVDIIADEKIGKVSIVGIGMKSHVGVASTMFRTLAENNINIQMISTSEIKISVVIDESRLDDAVRALHDAFDLGKEPGNE